MADRAKRGDFSGVGGISEDEVDGKIAAQNTTDSSTFVSASGDVAQTITGAKDFTTAPTINGDAIGAGGGSTLLAYAEHVTDLATASQYPTELDIPALSFTVDLDGSPIFIDCMVTLMASTTAAALVRIYRDGALVYMLAKESGIAASNTCFRFGSRRIIPTAGESTFTAKLSGTGGATATLTGTTGAAWIGVRSA
jgi:hypothetical protein